MQFSRHTALPPETIERPPCKACALPMWLVRIEPYKPGYDNRTFECPACQYEEMVVVKYRESA